MSYLANKTPTIKYWLALAGAAALLVSAQASATVLNFENANSAYGLNDNDQVTTQYQPSDGLTFQGAYLEHTGGTDANPQGFEYDKTGKYDTQNPHLGSLMPGVPGLGSWFLRSTGNIADRGADGQFGGGIFMKILYDNLVNGASGQIWDIDGHGLRSEQWNVLAYNGSTLVDSQKSPLGTKTGDGSLDGLPWTFSLSSTSGFDRIEFQFIGGKADNIGLAFDNFNATSAIAVPAPSSSIWLFGFGLGLLGLGLATRRRWESSFDGK